MYNDESNFILAKEEFNFIKSNYTLLIRNRKKSVEKIKAAKEKINEKDDIKWNGNIWNIIVMIMFANLFFFLQI